MKFLNYMSWFRLFGTLEHALLSVALPSLCSLAEKLIESQQENPTARDFVLCVAHATLTSKSLWIVFKLRAEF